MMNDHDDQRRLKSVFEILRKRLRKSAESKLIQWANVFPLTDTYKTDGWLIKLGSLGKNQPTLELWLDHYPNTGSRCFWFGFYSNKKHAIRAPIKSALSRLSVKRVLTNSDFKLSGGSFRLRNQLRPSEFNRPVQEVYYKKYSHLGIFDRTDSSSRAANRAVAERAAHFFLGVLQSAASMADAASEGMSPSKWCPSIWVVKCRKKLVNGRKGGNWHRYLDHIAGPRDKIWKQWGGPEWIRSHLSRKFIREDFCKHDLVLCYQKEGRQILGFTRLASDAPGEVGSDSAFDLAAPATAYVFKKPLSIEELRTTGCSPEAFEHKFRGTILKMSKREMLGVVAAITAYKPDEAEGFLLWLKFAGFGDGSRPVVKHLGNNEFRAENSVLDQGGIARELRALEQKFTRNDDVYIASKVNAIIRRDGPLINALKRKYAYQCQFPGCESRILKKSGGYYCEVGHILAVAKGGGASRVNLLVLCPNHHKAIDYGATEILENASKRLKIKLNGKVVIIKR